MTTLIEELNKPSYAAMVLANDYSGLEAALMTRNISEPATGTFVTELGILDLLGPTNGNVFLAGIEAASASNQVLERVIRWLRSDRGIDVGNSQVQAVLGQLVAAGVVTSESANIVIAHGTRLVSVADRIGINPIGYGLLKNTIDEMKGS